LPVVYPSADPTLLSCEYQLTGNSTDQQLAQSGIADLFAAGLLSASQVANTSSDSLMVTGDPLDPGDAIVIVNVPGTTETQFAGGGGGGYENTVAYAAILPMTDASDAVGLGAVPW
jgi:hypothetical protein